jgi:putative addiction module component (TIGR02574 family)
MQINIDNLNPIERMELADALYDSAMQEIESADAWLTGEQQQELDRRISRLHAGDANLFTWNAAYEQLTQGR